MTRHNSVTGGYKNDKSIVGWDYPRQSTQANTNKITGAMETNRGGEGKKLRWKNVNFS